MGGRTGARAVKRMRFAGLPAQRASRWRDPPASRLGRLAMTTLGPGGSRPSSSRLAHRRTCLRTPQSCYGTP